MVQSSRKGMPGLPDGPNLDSFWVCCASKLGEMTRIIIAAAVVLLAMPLAGQQQDSSSPSSAAQHNSPPSGQKKSAQQNSAHKPSSAEQNPFPEAKSEAAARKAQQEQDQNQNQNATPSAPAPQQGDPSKSPPAEQNPFPQEQSEKAAQQDQKQSGSGSGQAYSSSQSGLKGLAIPETNRDAREIQDPNLGKKDTQIGLFYLKTGDYKGAYERFTEAVQIDPGNADAVFGLAESARHLERRDEAIRNYQIYLSALPDGPRAKAARKGLKDLGASPNF